MLLTFTVNCGHFQKRLTLQEKQKRVLREPSPRVVIGGPPGTGKTLVLMLKGLEWLKAGHDVIVFGLHGLSMPACRLVYLQLCEAYKLSQDVLPPDQRTWGQVRFEHTILRDASNLEDTLQAVLRHGKNLHVLMDDFFPEDGFSQEMTLVFMRTLVQRDPGIHLWLTHWFTRTPDTFTVHVLTESVRYPLPVLHQIRISVDVLRHLDMIPESHDFSHQPTAAYASIPEVIHTRHSGRGEKLWPVNSEQCGKKVAQILRDIGVGLPTERYQLRDVLVVTRNTVDPCKPPAAFLRGLEASGFPCQVFARAPSGGRLPVEQAFDDLILGKENKITLVNQVTVRGLDRRVIVCLTGAGPDEQFQLTAQDKQELDQSQFSSTLTFTDPSGNVTQSMTFTQKPSKAEIREKKKETERRMKAKMLLLHHLNIWTRTSEQLIVVHLPHRVEGGPPSGGCQCTIL